MIGIAITGTLGAVAETVASDAKGIGNMMCYI